jgi:hypothetical protein
MKYVTNNVSKNHWITTGIKIYCKCKKFLYIMRKTTNCSKIKVHHIRYCSVRKAKEMHYNELLISSTNKSKTSWNINIIDIGTAYNKKIIETGFKFGNRNISTNQSAKIFNNYFINSVDELITWQPYTEPAMFSLRESLSIGVPTNHQYSNY